MTQSMPTPNEMPFMIDAWLTSTTVRAMSDTEVRVFLGLLCHSWKKQGIEPAVIEDHGVIAGMIGVSARKFCNAWKVVSRQFVMAADGKYVNPRQEEIRRTFVKVIEVPQPAKPAKRAVKEMPRQPTLFSLTVPETEKGKPKASEDVGEVIRFYYQRWVERHQPPDGKPPRLSRADRGQAVTLVREYGLNRAKEFVDRYLRDDSAWFASQGHPLSLILRKVNEYRSNSTTRPVGYVPAAESERESGNLTHKL